MRKGQALKAGLNINAKSFNRADMLGGSSAIRFGEPESVVNTIGSVYTPPVLHPEHNYYVPPIDRGGLVRLLDANPHHGTIPYFKRNMAVKWYKQNSAFPAKEMAKCAFDFEVFGEFYVQIIPNGLGQNWWLKHLPAMHMRRRKKANTYCMLRHDKDPLNFKTGEVIQITEYDPRQSIYGRPQYFGGIHSVLVNQDATLFRRKYFNNGAHMGFILYTANADFKEDDEKKLKEQIAKSKGVGNFRSMFLNIPGGKPDSVKVIPVGDIAHKDEFEKIKNISRNDILSMWRIPGALAGIIAENNSGFGDLDKITKNNYENEVVPRQLDFLQLNEFLPKERQLVFVEPDFKQPSQ